MSLRRTCEICNRNKAKYKVKNPKSHPLEDGRNILFICKYCYADFWEVKTFLEILEVLF